MYPRSAIDLASTWSCSNVTLRVPFGCGRDDADRVVRSSTSQVGLATRAAHQGRTAAPAVVAAGDLELLSCILIIGIYETDTAAARMEMEVKIMAMKKRVKPNMVQRMAIHP
jgi:hypothetical protein